jgi:hypothetical protein
MRTIKFKQWLIHTKRKKQIEAWQRQSAILSEILDQYFKSKADEREQAANNV